MRQHIHKLRFLELDKLLDSKLLQNSTKDISDDAKKTMALRHGNSLKKLVSYLRYQCCFMY